MVMLVGNADKIAAEFEGIPQERRELLLQHFRDAEVGGKLHLLVRHYDEYGTPVEKEFVNLLVGKQGP